MRDEPISQEDPQAIEKITAKIADLKRDQETMKARNKAWKKDGAEGLIALGMNPDAAARIAQIIERYTYQDKQPHARYEITNNGSNIRRLEKRLEELKRKAITPLREPLMGNGWSLEEDADINRTCLRFDVSRVPDEIYHRLKSHGFRKTQENVWQRHRNDDAWYWAESIGKAYEACRRMAPGQTPYTPEEAAAVQSLMSDALDAEETVGSDELERFATEQRRKDGSE